MENSYINSPFANRAIYPTRFLPYVTLLVVSKFFRAFGIFLSYDLLKLINVVQFLFCVKLGSAAILVLLQKPFSNQRNLSRNQWFRILRHALFGNLIQLLWLFGLTLCGPLRTLLLIEHSDLVIIAGASALFSSTGGPSKFRGAVFFLIACVTLLLFDYDDIHEQGAHHAEGHVHTGILTHLFDHLTSLTGLSDHKGGVVVLFFTLCINVGYNSAAKRLSVDVGGSKRLHALSTLCGAGMLFPWAMLLFITQESMITSWFSMFFPLLLVVLLVFVVDFYIEAICVARLEVSRTQRLATISIILAALFLSSSWNHPFVSLVTTLRHVQEIAVEEHMMSGGLVFSVVLFIYATVILTGPTRGSKGSFIGYSTTGLPLYSFTEDALHKTSQSALIIAKQGLRQILQEDDSRKIFYFLCINLFFTFVELIYGVWTNSLGLISDGFHMLFDCSALVMGLYAAIMAKWKPTRIFSYGYDRVEILSGFINSLFLMVIAFFVFVAALSRMFDPPEIHTERLLIVSVLGLMVNLIGIKAFHHGHSHGGGSHGHSHGGHSHGAHGVPGAHGSHGHSHSAGKSHGHSHAAAQTGNITDNKNMQGVFLHILADTMGSVGVIVSTLLIDWFGLNIADPICSLFIAVLIFLSVAPLVRDTTQVLLLRTPEDKQNQLGVTLQKILSIEGVLSYRDEHFWEHSSKVTCGIIHVQVKPITSEQKIISQITGLFKEEGVTNMTVQVEKEAFFQHLSGLGTSSTQVYEMTKGLKSLNYENTQNFIKAI